MAAVIDDNPQIPTRHGRDPARARQVARPVGWLVRGNPEPDEQRWQALGEALMHGDPPMDRLLDWMQDYGLGAAQGLFRQASEQGIDSIPDAPEPLRVFFEQVEQPPAWLDDALLARGAEVSHQTGLTGLRVLRDMALMGGYQASAINKTLVLTGELDRGPQRRLAETTKWWLDCTASGGMDRFAPGYANTLQVRLIHGLIRRRLQRQPDWSNADMGLPINQLDMAATHLGFCVVFLIGSRMLGIPLSRGDGDAVMHLWRYIDWLLGVDERWLPATEQEGRTLLYQILLSQPAADDSSRQLGHALMNEPFDRHYPNFAWLRGQYERARHVSITRLFTDAQGMRDLGLPAWVPPWYPAIQTPLNLARHASARALPGGSRRLARIGRARQTDYLRILFGEAAPSIHEPVAD